MATVFAYPDGVVTELPLSAATATERSIGLVSVKPQTLLDLRDCVLLNFGRGQGSGGGRMTLHAQGSAVNLPQLQPGIALAWDSKSRRLLSVGPFGSDSLQYEVVPTSGVLSESPGTISAISTLTPPLRLASNDGLLVTGNGRILDLDLRAVGALSNDIVDAAWLPGALYTIRAADAETEIQQWSRTTYLESRRVRLAGRPVRLHGLGDSQIVVITELAGAAAFTVLNADLSVAAASRIPLAIEMEPQPTVGAIASAVTLAVVRSGGAGPASYRWMQNGADLPGATDAKLTLTSLQPANAGVYRAVVSDGETSTMSQPAIVGPLIDSKTTGYARELRADIFHPSGRIFDQMLLEGAAASITADAGQVTRMSYVDMNDDIVQVEFSGAGTLTLVMSGAWDPVAAPPAKYNQPTVNYRKGHASLVIVGADETTNVSVFSVGRITAVDQTLFRSDVSYDGIADIGFIAILSRNGNFGGLRCANVSFFASKGLTGVYAPGVEFTGPVYVGDIDAFDDAEPVLILGSATGDTQINGGDLSQTNAHAVRVNGLTQLKFVAGVTSHGLALPAQANQARLERDGVDVTAQVVIDP